MSSREQALKEFESWLPGEMAYSAGKASYADKVDNRARRAPTDPRSMYGFLSQE